VDLGAGGSPVSAWSPGGGSAIIAFQGSSGSGGSAVDATSQCSQGTGVRGASKYYNGIIGTTEASGYAGVRGEVNDFSVPNAAGVSGGNDNASGIGVAGWSSGGKGVQGWSSSGKGVYAWCDGSEWALWVEGRAHCTNGGWSDLAENLYKREDLEGGDVVVIDTTADYTLRKSTTPYDPAVAGIISAKPTITVGDLVEKRDSSPLALAGVVPCKVTALNGPIGRGDLLTTSSSPGYAMKATNPKIGTIVGKALESLESGEGKIHVLVMLR